MSQVTVPMIGRVAQVTASGIVRGDENIPLSPIDLVAYARAKGITVPKLRYKASLVSLDVEAGTMTLEVQGVDGYEAATDTFISLVKAAGDSVAQMRQVLKDELEPGDVAGRLALDLRVTAEQIQQWRDSASQRRPN